MSGINTPRVEFNYQLFSEGSSDGYVAIARGSAIGSSTHSFGNPIGTPYTFMIAPGSPTEHVGDPVQISFSILTTGYLYVNHTAVVNQDVSFNSRGAIQTSTESTYFSHAHGVPSNATNFYNQYENSDAFTLNSRIGDTISLLYDGWMMNLVGGDLHPTLSQAYYNTNFSIEVNPAVVPIPSAAWLLGSGIVGFVALRRKLR